MCNRLQTRTRTSSQSIRDVRPSRQAGVSLRRWCLTCQNKLEQRFLDQILAKINRNLFSFLSSVWPFWFTEQHPNVTYSGYFYSRPVSTEGRGCWIYRWNLWEMYKVHATVMLYHKKNKGACNSCFFISNSSLKLKLTAAVDTTHWKMSQSWSCDPFLRHRLGFMMSKCVHLWFVCSRLMALLESGTSHLLYCNTENSGVCIEKFEEGQIKFIWFIVHSENSSQSWITNFSRIQYCVCVCTFRKAAGCIHSEAIHFNSHSHGALDATHVTRPLLFVTANVQLQTQSFVLQQSQSPSLVSLGWHAHFLDRKLRPQRL